MEISVRDTGNGIPAEFLPYVFDKFRQAVAGAKTAQELFDLIVFDGFLPPELPRKPILAFAPPATSGLGVVDGTLDLFRQGQPSSEDPLLRGVDLTRLHIARTQSMELPTWARPVIPGTPGPLVYAGLRERAAGGAARARRGRDGGHRRSPA